jgi:hypothetical protein
MSIDDIARRAGQDLRTAVGTGEDIDLHSGLAAVQEAHARRRRRRHALAAAVAAVAVAASVQAVRAGDQRTPTPTPAHQDSQSTSPSTNACIDNQYVACMGASQVSVVVGPARFRAELAEGFTAQPSTGQAPAIVDLLQHTGQAGVTLFFDPQPADGSKPGTSALDLASWISTRPYLEASHPRRAHLGGRPAWVVDARLTVDAARKVEAPCNADQVECWALLKSGATEWQTGPWTGMVCSYYVVGGPGGRYVVWSWAFDPTATVLHRNADVVRSLRLTRSPD